MSKILQFLIGAALALGAGAAASAAPTISGKYAVLSTAQCEAALSVAKNRDGLVTEVDASEFGPSAALTGYVTFTPANSISGSATGSLTQVRGGSLRVGTNGSPMRVTTLIIDGPYSLTATTLTIGADHYFATFGNVVRGIAHTLYLIRKENSRCVDAVSLTRQ